MHTRLSRGIFWALFAVCVALRVPSLQQPAGADQALYASKTGGRNKVTVAPGRATYVAATG